MTEKEGIMHRARRIAASLVVFIVAAGFHLWPHGAGDRAAQPARPPSKASAPEREQEFFTRLYHPYGAALPVEVLSRTWEEIARLTDADAAASENSTGWQCIGPFGSPPNYLTSPTAIGRYTGRVLDVESSPAFGLRFAAASGGLWGTAAIIHVPLSDGITSLAVGSFDTKPGDPNTIVLGTGEYAVGRTGTGFWRTTDGGQTWSNPKPLNAYHPSFVYKVRFDPLVANRVHAATTDGYYRSTDAGRTWYRWLEPAHCTDIAFATGSSGQVIYLGLWSHGAYRSTDAGISWDTVGGGLPRSGNGRVNLTASPGQASGMSVMYAAMQRNDRDSILGLFKSLDAGYTWTSISAGMPNPADTRSYEGYAGAIAVCPDNPNIVLLAWVKSYITADGGQTWYLIDNVHPDNHDNTHDDWHAFHWAEGGTVYGASDGGVFMSSDYGATWRPTSNTSPITQFYSVAVGGPGNSTIIGGTQDNGVIGTSDGGHIWVGVRCCDGAGVAVSPPDGLGTSWLYAMYGSLPGAGNRVRSDHVGTSWTLINQGLPPSSIIRTDEFGVLYTNAGARVYRSTDRGDSWTALNATPFTFGVSNVTVGRHATGRESAVYACLSSVTPHVLRVLDNGTWYNDRYPPIDANKGLVKVVPHPVDPDVAFAIVNGFTFWGDGRIWKTTNRGASWTDMTGYLPNVPVTDLVPHPTNPNVSYVGTAMGCYKTETAGQYWSVWNLGMPKATLITEMTFIDESATGGGSFVLAASYGRSLWKREISTDDPISTPWMIRNPGLIITDFTTIRDTMNLPPQTDGTVIRAALRLDSLLHDRTRDVTLVLVHAGVRDTILYRAGAEGQNFVATTLSDEAPLALGEGQAPFSGPYRPYQPLSQFYNLPATGPWILEVSDDGPGAVGALIGWSLRVEYRTAGGQMITSTVPLQAGWNIVSVPHAMSDYTRPGLFPGSTSDAFEYNAGYTSASALVHGKGYWLKSGTSESRELSGYFRDADTIPVVSGWNLIGSISGPVAVTAVASVPPGLVTSPFFSYSTSGYVAADSINPGLGYWLKVSGPGSILLSRSYSNPASRITILPTADLPPPPPGEEAAPAAEMPAEFALEQNYPNPFNPVTTITFAIPIQNDRGGTLHATSLQVFDLLGRHVATLVDDSRAPGVYSVQFNASHLASGMYIYRLTAGGFTATRRMILLK